MISKTSFLSPPRLLRFLALGDSYTIGEGVAPGERWPIQLVQALRARGVPVEDPVIVAQTGWTTSDLIEGVAAAAPAGPFDLVSLLIGVNNQYRGELPATYQVEFRALLNSAIDYAGGDSGRVLVLSIPDWGVTPFAAGHERDRIAAEIDAFNEVNQHEAIAASVHYLDVTERTRETGSEPSMLAEDGLHPSGAIYATWVEAMLPVAQVILSPAAKA